MRDARSSRDRSRGRLGLALAIAFGLHAAFVALIFRLHQSTVTPEVITIDLRTREAPVRPPPPAPETMPPATPRKIARVKRAPKEPVARAPEEKPATIAPPADQPVTPPAAAPPAIAHGEDDAAPKIDLFPKGDLEAGNQRFRAANGDKEGESGFVYQEPSGNGPVAEKARVSGRIARDVADAQAKSRVDGGLFDPYFVALEHAARDAFHPTVGMLGGDDDSGLGASATNMLKTWNASGKQFAQTGSPYADGEKPTGIVDRHEVQRDPVGNSGFDANDFLARWNAGDFKAPGTDVIVELVQRADGTPIRTTIIRSSGNHAFDDAAAKAIETAAADRLAPTHGLGLGGRVIRSRWALSAKFVTNTVGLTPDATGISRGAGFVPGIMVGGTMDLATGEAHVDTPGVTKVLTRVTLLAIYGGEAMPHAE